MTTLIASLLLLVIWHFVYESTVAENWRMELRNELFSLRDDLRSELIKNGGELDFETFNISQDRINSCIHHLGSISFYLLYVANNAIARDPNLKRLIESRREKYTSHKNDNLHKINKMVTHVWFKAILVNSGGWIIFWPPILVGLVGIKSANWCQQWFAKTAGPYFRNLSVLPESRYTKLERGIPDFASIA